MGGKSSSSTAQTSNQTTVQLSSDGVVAGDQLQSAGGITIYDYLPENVVGVFGQLIDFARETAAGAAEFGNQSLNVVSQNEEREENPELAAMSKMMPLLMLGVAAIAVIMIFKKG